MDRNKFDDLLCECKNAIERFVYYKLPSKADGDDVLQEVYLTAFQKFDTLKDESSFKAWMIRIAQNKCNDYYRACAKHLEIPLDESVTSALTVGRFGIVESSPVRDTLEMLADKDKQIIYLYYFKNMPQAQISKLLGIPLGTVKSRLHTSKQNFKDKYPYPPISKGANTMKKLPEIIPKYKITKLESPVLTVTWEELMGWFIVPRLGEKLSWAIYDVPSGVMNGLYKLEVTGRAVVHGIEGVSITAYMHNVKDDKSKERYFVAQLTDTHVRFLAESHMDGDVKMHFTFLDGDDFLKNWGVGEDNCGNETNISAKGDIIRNGSEIKSVDKPFLLDIVGRYEVEINGKTYETVCVMDIDTYNPGVVSEQYLDQNGRTILWRRFNRDDWAYNRYKQKWSEKLPQNDRLTINGKIYVHWYDCITDYIL